MSTSAQIAVEREGNAVIARVTGEVDMTNSRYVGEELTRSVPNDALHLIVDITDTRYIDSAGIELLFDLSRRLDRRRQDLRLVLPSESPLRRVLSLTEIESAAPVHDSLAAALAE